MLKMLCVLFGLLKVAPFKTQSQFDGENENIYGIIISKF